MSERKRDMWRCEIAALLDLDPAALPDETKLPDDLALDSLAMMSLLAWLQAKGLSFADQGPSRRVGELLDLLARKSTVDNVSVVVVGSRNGRQAPTDLPAPQPVRSTLVPVLSNRAYRLAPIEDGDLGFLYRLAVHPETGYRWRYRGKPPPPERFTADLWGQVLVQYVAHAVESGQRAGLVVAYGADLAQGHAFVGSVFTPDHTGTGLPAQATAMFVRYLFHSYPLRKLYLEVPGFNWPQMRSGAGRLFQVEGVLRDHDFYAGRYWDKYLCAIYRPEDGTTENQST